MADPDRLAHLPPPAPPLDDLPAHIRDLALRVRACERGAPWPGAAIEEASVAWPLGDLLVLVHVLQVATIIWTVKTWHQMARAVREAPASLLEGAVPLVDQYAQARYRWME